MHTIIVLNVYDPESFREPWLSVDARGLLPAPKVKFFDDKYLLFEENSLLRLVDVETGDPVTCNGVGPNDHVRINEVPFCVCRKTDTVVYHSSTAKTPDIMKLWLPHQRDMRK